MDAPELNLKHSGVKGMKWGVHKAEAPASAPKRAAPKSADAKKGEQLFERASTKGVTNLSNQELQTLITRMNLHQQYNRLASEPAAASSVTRGEDAVKKLLGHAAMAQTVYRHIESPLGQKVIKKVAKIVKHPATKTAVSATLALL